MRREAVEPAAGLWLTPQAADNLAFDHLEGAGLWRGADAGHPHDGDTSTKETEGTDRGALVVYEEAEE